MRARRFAAAAGAALCLLAARPLAAQPKPGETKIAIVPAAPTTDDLINVVIESEWPDGCTPGFTELRVEPGTTGLRYVITLTGGPEKDEGCLTAVTPFKVDAPLGHVPAGTHEVIVEGRHQSIPDFLIEFGRVTFTVGGEAASDLVLHGGRFRVQVSWTDFAGGTGVGRVVPGAGQESGLFWFFAPDNWELLIKVLDACTFNGRWWVLGAAATNVRYKITVRDTVADETWSYENPLGTRSPAILDTDAFDNCAPVP